jgi:beta-lactam-binding protein with PASTA domain
VVSVLSAGGILLSLFGQYHRSYTGIVIPNVVGQDAETLLSEQSEHLNWVIEYETNPLVPAGQIISQSPPAGVTRRLYGRDRFCDVYLCVSRATTPYTLENLIGMRQRDAVLTLRNHQISATVTELYSNTVPKGQVLETIPPTGTPLTDGATVTLRVSAGKKENLISVPNLFGMTETEANALLKSIGLSIGTVRYQTSSRAAGTIITQDLAAYSPVQNDTALSYTVSVGDRFALLCVPDLYGMQLKDAEKLLAQHGLLIGQIHTVQNAAPKGTVLLQSPSSGAPITSSTVSVELYVSS